ncbi:ligase-associated DNA damage response exonuclease [Chitinophaga silvatica]|uniref:Ligase-associated DNA damage response exonuclease n=1 Tax=Chitinophaga silvatica TaxID=2282649 RepID=A0A3E1YDU8_9BACT|nr:ligase-associated DNA damage response exonuclease [Chitinophaga silvatica]RFS24644.1 ligase-associated DNA damage response exonuclease [Chitinophaga silvatica]
MKLLEFTDKGIYCSAGDFYIDPWQPVKRAVITHAHADHARYGNQYYLCEHATVPLLKLRLGSDIKVQGVAYHETVIINGVTLSLIPAGHMIGSAQIKVDYGGEVWVASGDYKLENDGLSVPFEPVKCHSFITESTFGLPIYRWQPQEQIFSDIFQWISNNKLDGKASVLLAYSLGKAQRLLFQLKDKVDRFLVHGAIAIPHETLLSQGWLLPPVERITPETPKEDFKNAVIIAPPSAEDHVWLRRMQPYSLGICSGWMQVRGNMRRRNADAGFVLSDHADWNGLLKAVKETSAAQVFVTHGFSSVFARYLTENGILASAVSTDYGDEEIISNPEP